MQFIESRIAKSTVFMFSSTTCPYCRRTKQLLNELGVKYDVEEIDKLPNIAEIKAALATITGSTSVPKVFVAGKSIGGCSDTEKLHKEGKLMKILKDANAQF